MTSAEIKAASLGSLWTRLEALEFAANPRDQDEMFQLQKEISARDRPWARLQASFDAAAADEQFP